MPTPQTTVIYPFDPTGRALSNRITGERQILTPPDWSDFYFILPAASPFFAESLTLTLRPSGKVLVEGVDYNPSHRFYDATVQCASPVYGSISFLDKTLSGVVEYDYQTLGGDWVINTQQAAQVLANTLLNPRTTTWEEVVDLPYQFPPVDHAWDIKDMTGAKDMVSALDQIVVALQESGDQGLAQHLADFNNPHRVTKVQVGLGDVQNFDLATVADAIAGVSNAKYMTPSTTQQAVIQFAVTPLNAHVNSTANPHNVTKTQIGLSNVLNYGVASMADAQAGVATTGYMTPVLTAAAITQQALIPLNTHVTDLSNPHGVTKTQVGLSNVPNYPMATTNEATAGVATDRLMSPALVKAMLQTGLGGNLQAHLDDHNNPHVVTKTQVGLSEVQNFPMASSDLALAGSDTSSYMNPALTMAVVTAQLLPFTGHLSDTNNPHEVTAAQVGLDQVQNYPLASTAAAQAGLDNTSYMTPALTKAAIAALANVAISEHISDLDNPHEVTAAQVGLGMVQNLGVADDATAIAASDRESYVTPAGVGLAVNALAVGPLNAHVADTNNPHEVTAAQVGLGNVANYALADAATAIAGTNNATYMSPALTAQAIQTQVGNPLAAHTSSTSNPHQVTAAQVGAYSASETDDAIFQGLLTKLDKTAQADDSKKLEGKSLADVMALVDAQAGAVTYYTYPSQAPAEGDNNVDLWTGFAIWPAQAPEVTEPRREFVGWIMGGEDVGETEVPIYRITVNMRGATPSMTVVQHAGKMTSTRFVLTMDGGTQEVTLWLASAANRNGFALSINSDAGGTYSVTQLSITEPANVVADAVTWVYDNDFVKAVGPNSGELAFTQNFAVMPVDSGIVGQPTALVAAAPLVQFLNVATTPEEVDAALLVTMPLKSEWRHFGRTASQDDVPVFAAPLDVWGWNDPNGAITCSDVSGNTCVHTLLSPEAWPSDQVYTLEVELRTDDISKSEQALGLCLGQYVQNGKSRGLWAMVNPATSVLELWINYLQTDAFLVGTATYTPSAASGGECKGMMKVTAPLSSTDSFTIQVSRFVAAADVHAAYSADFAPSLLGPEATVWRNGRDTVGSYHWGFAAKVTGPDGANVAAFVPAVYPDSSARYVSYAPGTDGTDASTVNYYTGTAWVSSALTAKNGLIPGRMVYSESTSQFYFTRRDGTLTPLPIVGASPGGAILTT